MRKSFVFGLSCILFLCGALCLSQAQLPQTGAGKGGSGGSYSGPGAIAAATAWYGLRAYSAAKAAALANVVNLKRSSDSTTSDIPVLANGHLNTSIAFFDGSTYTIQKLYDQTGGGNDLVAATQTLGFVITGNGLTVPNMSSVSAGTQFLTVAVFPSTPPPYTLNFVANHTASTIQSNAMQINNSAGGNSVVVGYRTSANNQAFYFDGANQPVATATDAAWHTITGSTAGSSSGTGTIFAVDATQATSTNAGAITFGGAASGTMLVPNTGAPFDGFMAEIGVWGVALNSSQITALYNQQSVYYGAVF
jgi:hypothetical protein